MVILMTMLTLPLAHVKSHLSELVGRVRGEHERVTVTVHGRPQAVLISVEDLDILEETIEVLSQSETMTALALAEREVAAGLAESQEELADAMRERKDR